MATATQDCLGISSQNMESILVRLQTCLDDFVKAKIALLAAFESANQEIETGDGSDQSETGGGSDKSESEDENENENEDNPDEKKKGPRVRTSIGSLSDDSSDDLENTMPVLQRKLNEQLDETEGNPKKPQGKYLHSIGGMDDDSDDFPVLQKQFEKDTGGANNALLRDCAKVTGDTKKTAIEEIVPVQIRKIRKVLIDAEKLQNKVDNFRGSKTDKQSLKQKLEECCVSLDEIDTEGKQDIKQERKRASVFINDLISKLEEAAHS